MPALPPTCANCGSPLSDAQGICPRCDPALTYPHGDPTSGRYPCPHCQARFDTPMTGLYPPNPPWYRPQAPVCQCPHCGTFLKDRASQPMLSLKEQVLAFSVLLFSGLIRLPQINTIRILLAIALFTAAYRRHRRRMTTLTDDERYVALDTRPSL